jgi:hypothetical protein
MTETAEATRQYQETLEARRRFRTAVDGQHSFDKEHAAADADVEQAEVHMIEAWAVRDA